MTQPSVAVLGASADRSKFSNKSLRAHLRGGYAVYPVNPKGGSIEGLPVYRSLAEIPVARLTRITVYLAPPLLIGMLEEIAAVGCDRLYLNPGTDSPEVLAEAARLGLNAIAACSIVELGFSPAEFPD